MKMRKNIVALTILAVFGFSLLAAASLASAAGPEDGQFSGEVTRSGHQNRYRNRFQFQLQVNASVNLDMEVSDDIGDHEFQFQFNCSEEGEQLRVKVQAENPELGLEEGKQIQAKNQNRYRYQHRYMMNLSYEGEGEFQAKLQLKTQDGDCTWAYYDEAAEQWETVESTYENGMITTETDHFSLWTVLSENSVAIPGFALLGVMSAIGVIGLIISKRK